VAATSPTLGGVAPENVAVAESASTSVMVALPNTTEEGPRRRFLVRPSDYRLAEQKATELGGELLGFYHSHPDHPAQWSKTDFAEAHWIGCSYVITSVQKGTATVTNSFLLSGTGEEDKVFLDEPLHIIEAAKADEVAT